MERLPRLMEDEFDRSQTELFALLTSGPRSSDPHVGILRADGSLIEPFGLMLYAPETGKPLQELGSAIRFSTSLTDRVREIAILKTASANASSYVWQAHRRIGLRIGLEEDEVDSLSRVGFNPMADDERAAILLCEIVLAHRAATDDEFETLARIFSARQLVELAVLVGYYTTIGRMMTFFGVEPPDDGQAS